jgi:hypothetical protein
VGEKLKTPDGQVAVADGGTVPAQREGWMWDLTVPGNNDHDFYVTVGTIAVLVHNCPDPLSESGRTPDRNGMKRAGRAFQKHYFRGGFTPPTAAGFLGDTQAANVMNALGQDTLDEILTNPQTATQEYGDVMDMKLPWGGARFVNGIFDGFLSP